MVMLKQLLNIMPNRPTSRKVFRRSRDWIAGVGIAVFVVATICVIIIRAADNQLAYEPEQADLTGGATKKSDAAASGGFALQFTAVSPANPPPYGAGEANGPQGSWKLKLNDNFDGTTLDTNTWSTGWLASGVTPPVQSQELACYDPQQVTVAGGILKLSAVERTMSCGGKQRPYASGAINSADKQEFSYGFFEAKIWLDASATDIYNWPAWWLDGHSWPDTGELDVMEGLSGGARATWHGPEGDGSGHGFGDAGVLSGWHVFAAEWEPGKVTAFYDGKNIGSYSSSSNITASPQFLILMAQMSPEGQYGGPIKAPSELNVDYVRVWQR